MPALPAATWPGSPSPVGGLAVEGDRGQLTQLVLILLDNALKYADERGSVDIGLERRHHAAHLAVANTGEGIAAEHLPRIFDRFYRVDPSRTREPGGYGLGLAIAKAIVDRHKGRISVHSVPGKTTTFTVELSLSPAGRNQP
jgi:signal transduction histidine kinase